MQLERVVGYQRSRDEVVEGLERERTTMRPVVACRLVRARGRRGAELGAAATLLAAGDVGSAPSPSRPCAHSPRVHAVPLVPRAKVAPPSVPNEFVVRKQLLTDLDDASDVVTVWAPAGFGKTALLADWVRTSPDVVTAWVNVDRDDNDPRRLWSAVSAAVAASPSVPTDSSIACAQRWPTAQPEYLAELVEALGELERPVRLILDDAHELVGAKAMHGLDVLIRNRPANVVLVLSSRCKRSGLALTCGFVA